VLRNYIVIAVRNIRRHKGNAFINITGLAVGMATCILIMLWVVDELSYDRFHKDADHIYRLCHELTMGGTTIHTPTGSDPMAPAIQAICPEVSAITRIKPRSRTEIIYGNNRFFEENILYADSQFFSVFTFPLAEGDPQTALARRHCVVITRDIARKYFGEDNPLGKTLQFRAEDEYTVTGIIDNVPANSHLSFDFLGSFRTLYHEESSDISRWGDLNTYTYMRVSPAAGVGDLENKISQIIDEHLGNKIKSNKGDFLRPYLQPLTDIHLYSRLNFVQDISAQRGRVTYILLFTGIALGVLLIAGANFINLTTAESVHRVKEIGIRKTFGADHSHLAFQLLTESILLSLAALIVALVLMELALPSFNAITQRELELKYFVHPEVMLGLVLFAAIVGLIAGMYPALSLSSMKPSAALRGRYRPADSRSVLRRILVVGQYTISIALIIGTAMIYDQVHFMKNKNLGFAADQVLIVPGFDIWPSSPAAALASEIEQIPGVTQVSRSSAVPGGEDVLMTSFRPEGSNAEEILMVVIYADEYTQPTFGLELAAGRNFSRQMGSDSLEALLINEAAARKLGWEDPIGKTISWRRESSGESIWEPRKVIGVIKDFHYTNLRESIEPVVIIWTRPISRYLSIRIETTDIPRTLGMIRDCWDRRSHGVPFDYFFADQKFAEQYRAEERLGKIAISFSLLAIFVACLGLFGMASHVARRRTKEIGVRKVLGATTSGIIALLATELVKWVLVANVIAWPVAYYIMNRWLQDFAYRTSISPDIFVISGALALAVAIATVGYQAVRAARANPVDSLKYE